MKGREELRREERNESRHLDGVAKGGRERELAAAKDNEERERRAAKGGQQGEKGRQELQREEGFLVTEE